MTVRLIAMEMESVSLDIAIVSQDSLGLTVLEVMLLCYFDWLGEMDVIWELRKRRRSGSSGHGSSSNSSNTAHCHYQKLSTYSTRNYSKKFVLCLLIPTSYHSLMRYICYYPSFMGKETTSERWNNLTRVT